MMKHTICTFTLLLIVSVFFLGCKSTRMSKQNPEQYVNNLIGTDIRTVPGLHLQDSERKGQTMPTVGVPHGMTNWVAQTHASENKCFSPYYYNQNAIQGFRASHWMTGSCTQDYGSVTIMPLSMKLETDVRKRASKFSHDREITSPSYYSVVLDDYNIKAEMTGLSRSGILNFTFEQDGDQYIVIEPNSDRGDAFIQINSETKEISGYNPTYRIYQGWGQKTGFSGYFVIRLNEDFDSCGVWVDGKISEEKEAKGNKNNVGVWIKLKSSKAKTLTAKIGTSFTSVDNARKNLEAEIPHWNFANVRKQSAEAWDGTLSKIEIKTDNTEQKTKFYTALYDANILPRAFSDVDGSYPKFDGGEEIMKASDFTYYCDFSMWDTYRAVHPLLSIMSPSKNGDMMKSLVLKGEQGGWLPIFPAWNSYTAAMIGDHCISAIGDAIVKETPGFDYEAAYKLMHKNAFEYNTDVASYKNGKGRRALDSYLKLGYIPLEDPVADAFHKKEQVSRTLEYAYVDFVLAQVAQKLDKQDDYKSLSARAQNYKNVINPANGFAQGRYADGKWIKPFDPYNFASFICEGTPFHYSWYVPHDVAGLVAHTGGKAEFTKRLDAFFAGDHYWHGNEPGHHIPYLYTYVGEAWKTQKLVHEIVAKEYLVSPDGLSGNDDAGQMSAWMVFSMMGFYPVCPGSPNYAIGSPFFEETVISLEDGKTFKISAPGASDKNIYIQSATLNGEPYNKSYIAHSTIMNGGEIVFVMGSTPNKGWGVE